MNFIEMKKVIDEKIEKEIEKNVELYKNGEKMLHKYNQYLLLERRVFQFYSDSGDPIETLEYMQSLQKHIDELALFRVDTSVDGDINDGMISWCQIEYELYELSTFQNIEQLDEHLYKKIFKKFMSDEIQDGMDMFGFTLDCKMLQLFKDDVIDFETLKKISLSNCSI